jgi:hypothetical protein
VNTPARQPRAVSEWAADWAWDQKTEDISAKAVLVALAKCCDRLGRGTWECWAAQETLAEMIDGSLSSVGRALRRLESLGLVTRHRRFDADGHRTTDLHVLNHTSDCLPVNLTGSRSDRLAVVKDETGPDQPKRRRTTRQSDHQSNRPLVNLTEEEVISKEITRERSKNSPPKRGYDDPEFAKWWAAYPKKAGKRAALQAFGHALKRAPFADILAGTNRYAEERADQEAKYTKDPSGWLNADRWADEPAATGRRPAGRGPYCDPGDQSAYEQPMFPDEEDTP